MRDDRSTDVDNPMQFRLLDLFALTTLVALASAMAAPILRGYESEYRNRLLIVIGLQLLFTAGGIVYFARKREKILKKSGQKIGTAFCGQFAWRYWPVAKMLFTTLLVVFVQIVFAIKMTDDLLLHGMVNGPFSRMIDDLPISHHFSHYLYYFSFFLDYSYYVQFSLFAGYAFSIYRWRAYPNSIEFFENGIVRRGTFFTLWKCIEVRPSSLFADKIVLVIRSSPDSIVGLTKMAQVSDQLRELVFATAKAGTTRKNSLST